MPNGLVTVDTAPEASTGLGVSGSLARVLSPVLRELGVGCRGRGRQQRASKGQTEASRLLGGLVRKATSRFLAGVVTGRDSTPTVPAVLWWREGHSGMPEVPTVVPAASARQEEEPHPSTLRSRSPWVWASFLRGPHRAPRLLLGDVRLPRGGSQLRVSGAPTGVKHAVLAFVLHFTHSPDL